MQPFGATPDDGEHPQAIRPAVSAPGNACRGTGYLTDQIGTSCPTRRLPSLLRMVCGLKPSRAARRHLASTMSTVLVWVMAGARRPAAAGCRGTTHLQLVAIRPGMAMS